MDKLSDKLKGWKAKVLSFAGRATLLKSAAMSMPITAMSTFQLPISTCDAMDSKMCRFWWGTKEEIKGCHLKAWSSLYKPKDQGGLGFRKMVHTNKALLAKLGWQLLNGEKKLWTSTMLRKYCYKKNFLEVQKKASDSMIWKGILKPCCGDLLPMSSQPGLCWLRDFTYRILVALFVGILKSLQLIYSSFAPYPK